MTKFTSDITVGKENLEIMSFLLRNKESYRLHQAKEDSYIYFQKKDGKYGWETISSSKVQGGAPSLFFHKDWNHLMLVVEEIKTIKLSEGLITTRVVIDNHGCTISNGAWHSSDIAKNTNSDGEKPDILKLTHKTVVDFIKYYNEKELKTEEQNG